MAGSGIDPEKAKRMAKAAAALRDTCTQCQRDLQSDWQFCAHCGVRLATACPACGVPLPPAGSAHCGHCGLVLIDLTARETRLTP